MATQSSGYRKFEFTTKDFNRIRELIYNYAGISLSDTKTDLVYSRLSRRLRHYGMSKFSEYIPLLTNTTGEEWEYFVNSLTTNLTAFFRENHHFDTLKQYAIDNGKKPIKIWCSAASTGEEPYSIAMSLIEVFETLKPPVKILATDLDTSVLETAKTGIYDLNKTDEIPKDQLKQFFLRNKNKERKLVKIKPEIKDLVSFKNLNLLDNKWPMKQQFDVIFCRNVMIYFDRETQYKILDRFAPLLKPKGLLFVGHSESFPAANHQFKLIEKTVYVRTGGH